MSIDNLFAGVVVQGESPFEAWLMIPADEDFGGDTYELNGKDWRVKCYKPAKTKEEAIRHIQDSLSDSVIRFHVQAGNFLLAFAENTQDCSIVTYCDISFAGRKQVVS